MADEQALAYLESIDAGLWSIEIQVSALDDIKVLLRDILNELKKRK